MNYRHAFHAGNFADCMKHALLVALLDALAQKPTPFAVMDTHAGLGQYDLDTGPATRTEEWRGGIGRLREDPPDALRRYIDLVEDLGMYPGSPALIRALLRESDQLICCELHPEDVAVLRRLFARDRQVSVHHRDGYEAIRALLPPAQKRGLVLIDPPFEQPDEFTRLAQALQDGAHRFRAGVFAAWYPIKGRAPVRAFHDRLAAGGMRDVVAAELWLREPTDTTRLNGCGLLMVNPPFRFLQQAPAILEALRARLGTGEAGEGHAILRIADE